MKKEITTSLIIALVLCMVLALTSCGKSSKNEDTGSGNISLDACYALAVENGFEGSMADFLEYIKGDSAYDIAVESGDFQGSEKDWLDSLHGRDGMDGQDASITVKDLFDEAKEQGFTGDYFDFLRQYLNVDAEPVIKNKSLLGSVSVYCRFDIKYSTFSYRGIQTSTQIGVSAGSGVFYSVNKQEGSAYIITNYHVVYNSDSEQGISQNIFVYLYGSEVIGNELYTEDYCAQLGTTMPSYRGMGIEATYLGGSQYYDIAVLYVENSDLIKNSSAVAVDFADSNDVVPGQTAYAVGNAEAKGISVTKGIISVDSENLKLKVSDNSGTASFRVMRIDTAVNSGNSGGGLFNDDGELIGIVNAKTTADGVENIGYSLPSNVVKYIAENIMYYKKANSSQNFDVRKCMLGITISSRESSAVLDPDTGKIKIKEKVMINEVQEDGLAQGKLQVGDILVTVKIHHVGDPEGAYEIYSVDRSFTIVDLMLTMRVGDELIVVYDRTTEGTTARAEATFVMTEQCIKEVS